MKIKKIVETLVLAACCTGSAQAGVISLQNASITGTYDGQGSAMLGLDGGFGPGSNTTHLSPYNPDAEFITSDYLFVIDFDASGNVIIAANDVIPASAHVMRFDFGSSLPANIASLSLTDMGGNGGAPTLSVIDAHTIEFDLSGITWNGTFSSFTAQLGSADASAVPEPGSITLLFAGLAGLALVRRPRLTTRR
jgi:hypothetical protein